jgi:ADP-heptose:LPS heptosyltransferase
VKIWLERGGWVAKRKKNQILGTSRLSIKRVVIIRHAAFGDMVLVRPFLVEARKFFPSAKIVLNIVSNYSYAVPEDLVDEIDVIDGAGESKKTLIEKLKSYRVAGHCDILFDAADTARSRYISLLSKAKIRVGFPYKSYLRRLIYDAAVWRSDYVFEATNMLHMLMMFGANPRVPLDFAWPTHRAALRPSREYLIFFPFASVDYKKWETDKYIKTIISLASDFEEYDFFVLGGVGKSESVDDFYRISSKMKNVFLQPSMELAELANFIGHARVLVSNDTGIRNMAIALGTPTIGIFFATVPYRYWPRYGNHDVVFNCDGASPSTRSVIERVAEILSGARKNCHTKKNGEAP